MTRNSLPGIAQPRSAPQSTAGNSPDVAAAAPAAPESPRAATLRAGSLEGLIPGLAHGFSTDLPFADLPAFGEALGGLLEAAFPGGRGNGAGNGGAASIMLEQPHAAKILSAHGAGRKLGGAGPKRDFVKGYDGAVGDRSHPKILSVRAADCVPVLAADPELGAYAALHAGWRGVAAGILPNLLGGWRRAGSSLRGVRLAFGPSIRACCFEVREDCTSMFQAEHLEGALVFQPAHIAGALHQAGGATHLDLIAVLLTQARALGVEPSQVETLPQCTACHRDGNGEHVFASYRRSRRQGLPTGGRNASFIGLAP